MYRRDLERLLSGKYFPNFFALYGSESFQTELFANAIRLRFKAEEELRLYFEEYDFSRASNFLGSASLFASSKLLEIKCTKKPSQKELEALIKLCKKDDSNFFLLEFYEEPSRQSELEKIFENNFARFFAPSNAKEGVQLLELRAKELKINATQNALYALYANFDENLYLAAAELNKFKELNIDENTIEKYSFSLSVVGFDAFFDKLLNVGNIQDDLEKLLDNFNEIALINSLHSSFYRLFKIALYAKSYGKADLKALLGYMPPPQIANKMINASLKLKITQFHQIFKLLLESEYELKTNSKLVKKEFLIASLLVLAKILRG
ncbi:DNA polymerase III subunit delta [Campylobacter troglodytis]|uniref:DNA polymerase III subunit delta n=1 Tax=Campylobacter troglodytis TaxID=654363 RepID=UPI00115805A6|nr:DNA polymerase III subunit delta [Campylobacter troglodytis]TQR54614.1 hypothetical protein DMC01_10030 [Campylobacter troglodytis]